MKARKKKRLAILIDTREKIKQKKQRKSKIRQNKTNFKYVKKYSEKMNIGKETTKKRKNQ